MKKNILIFGSISGLIVSINLVIMATLCYNNNKEFMMGPYGMILGFTAMIIAFAFIFVGIKNYRDKYNDGIISFSKAFKIGALIALISSTAYVLVWLIVLYNFIPDFMERYTTQIIAHERQIGTPPAELNEKIAKAKISIEDYKNPINVIWMTYAEILPLGLIVALVGALVMKRKHRKEPRLTS